LGKLMVGRTRFLLLCALLLVLPSIAAASSISFNVDSTQGWQMTSLDVTKGQQLAFSAVGSWTVDVRIPNSYVGPDGYSPQVDSTIFQGCKLQSNLPYGKLLARVGDAPFSAIGSNGAFTADRDGVLAFRIHDADACLGDNAGSVTVTITAAQFPNVPQTPFFYCISGPNGRCMNLYKNQAPDIGLPSPPAWLTSPLAAKCLIQFTGQVLDALMPGLGSLTNMLGRASFLQTFYTLAQQRGIPLEGAQANPLYWKTLVDALVQSQVVDKVTQQACRDWAATF
jgi:hypothetical protein